MAANKRFGGHFVQAHIDTTATIVSRTPDGDSIRLAFQLPPQTSSIPSILKYIVTKGYVAIDGASLTITQVDDAARTFGVMLILHTQERITLGTKEVGDKVNIEADIMGKYVEKNLVTELTGDGGEHVGFRAFLDKLIDDALERRRLKIQGQG